MPRFNINLVVVFSSHFPRILCKLVEQHTEEQQDTEAVDGETSYLDTNILEETAEATQSKDSLPLLLVNGNEIIVQDSNPDGVNLDATIEEEEDTSKKSPDTITVYG